MQSYNSLIGFVNGWWIKPKVIRNEDIKYGCMMYYVVVYGVLDSCMAYWMVLMGFIEYGSTYVLYLYFQPY